MAELTQEDAREITAAVREFTARSAALESLPGQLSLLTHRGRMNRLLIVVTIVGLVLDLAISGVFWRQHLQQDCLSNLRVAGSVIADSDRKNVDAFFAAVVSLKRPDQFQGVYARYQVVRDMNDAKRRALGQADSATCPLF